MKLAMDFDGLKELMEDFQDIEKETKPALEKALTVSQTTIAQALAKDMRKHKRTGKTAKSIITEAKPKWDGTTIGIDVGFDLHEQLTSIFLMYGTPRMSKDRKLYNDIYGKAIHRKILEKQQEALTTMAEEKLNGG